jgi:hypothetical protein
MKQKSKTILRSAPSPEKDEGLAPITAMMSSRPMVLARRRHSRHQRPWSTFSSFPAAIGPGGALKIACLAPLVALR